MVSQLLTLARLEPEQFQMPVSSLDLNSLASQVIAKFALSALDKQIDLGLLSSEPVLMEGNSDYLEILISNLVDNAIRYGSPGGTVNVSVLREAEASVLKVDDDGRGIPERDWKRVFERFVRLGNGSEGSGIGLAIVQKIASLHGAKIELGQPLHKKGLIVTIEFKRRNDETNKSPNNSPH